MKPFRRALIATLGLTTALATGLTTQAAAAVRAHHFKSCTDMHKTYKHGVGKQGAHDHVRGSTKPVTNFKRSNALYSANSGMDRDHDGVACEAH